ncbi:MAG: DUF1254 domain-containing protein [Flavobacteriaceae bacterium]|nr:DUF1254 domain-containing protein [Flavobacteriaceae bacterium]
MKQVKIIASALLIVMMMGCNSSSKKEATTKEKLTDQEIENIVRHSFQYVAMYNVTNNFAMMEANPLNTGGWNKTKFATKLTDHTVKAIARPNNDTYYILSTLDLRDDAIIISYPAINSKYVSLETSAYDHYIDVPLSTSKGDFEKPTTILYYTDRTKNYQGEAIEGIDKTMKMTGDFAVAFLRLAPHINDKERANGIIKSLDAYKLSTLAEFQGKQPVKVSPVDFPAYGNDQMVFKNNFLEVMQFVFNHTSFDPNDAMDNEALTIFASIGIKPNSKLDSTKVAMIDGNRFAEIAAKIAKESLATWNNPSGNPHINDVFLPKGEMTLDVMVMQSAVGPIGLPASEALYPGIGTVSGEPLNDMNDYVIKMKKEELPPATAFWSTTLYDYKNGFFIPNDRHKYIVGENGGMKLNKEGGIEIYIAAEKPEGVPEENWLPINRENIDLDVILRIYAPDVEKMKNWKAPKAEKIIQ